MISGGGSFGASGILGLGGGGGTWDGGRGTSVTVGAFFLGGSGGRMEGGGSTMSSKSPNSGGGGSNGIIISSGCVCCEIEGLCVALGFCSTKLVALGDATVPLRAEPADDIGSLAGATLLDLIGG